MNTSALKYQLENLYKNLASLANEVFQKDDALQKDDAYNGEDTCARGDWHIKEWGYTPSGLIKEQVNKRVNKHKQNTASFLMENMFADLPSGAEDPDRFKEKSDAWLRQFKKTIRAFKKMNLLEFEDLEYLDCILESPECIKKTYGKYLAQLDLSLRDLLSLLSDMLDKAAYNKNIDIGELND